MKIQLCYRGADFKYQLHINNTTIIISSSLQQIHRGVENSFGKNKLYKNSHEYGERRDKKLWFLKQNVSTASDFHL